jgi:hypothetical protein
MSGEYHSGTAWGVTEHKNGSYRATPEWWKQLVRDELKRRGRGSRSALAIFCGCATSAITQLLAEPDPSKPNQPPAPNTSRIAAKVAEFTGIPLPDEIAFDGMGELLAEVERLRKAHGKEGFKMAINTVRTLRILAEKPKPDK